MAETLAVFTENESALVRKALEMVSDHYRDHRALVAYQRAIIRGTERIKEEHGAKRKR